MKKEKTVIFDVDGVLIDSVPIHFTAWEKTFKNHGVLLSFEMYLKGLNGQPRLAGIKNIVPNASNKEVERIAREKQQELLRLVEQSPIPAARGVMVLLKQLKQLGFYMVAASSSKNSPLFLEKAGISPFLSAVITGADFSKPKPDPEIFLVTSNRINASPQNCVVVEDAAAGIIAANRAGMKTIGVLSSHDNKISELANLTVSSLEEKQKILSFLAALSG